MTDKTLRAIDGLWWPPGYSTDPNGKVVGPHGCEPHFTFGYDLGYKEAIGLRTPPAPVASDAKDAAIRGLLCRLVDQLGERDRGNGNAPGHGHDVPGVWDSDNGAKAGTACAWCALWAEAKKVRAALPPSGAGEKTS